MSNRNREESKLTLAKGNKNILTELTWTFRKGPYIREKLAAEMAFYDDMPRHIRDAMKESKEFFAEVLKIYQRNNSYKRTIKLAEKLLYDKYAQFAADYLEDQIRNLLEG